jgi:hypothetical protein
MAGVAIPAIVLANTCSSFYCLHRLLVAVGALAIELTLSRRNGLMIFVPKISFYCPLPGHAGRHYLLSRTQFRFDTNGSKGNNGSGKDCNGC